MAMNMIYIHGGDPNHTYLLGWSSRFWGKSGEKPWGGGGKMVDDDDDYDDDDDEGEGFDLGNW